MAAVAVKDKETIDSAHTRHCTSIKCLTYSTLSSSVVQPLSDTATTQSGGRC
jgi:hypothetical protein